MKRREFITLIGGTAVAWPLAARAQQTQRVPRIGVLLPGTPSSFAVRAEALRQGLRDFGHVEGRTIAIEWRFAEEKFERLPDLELRSEFLVRRRRTEGHAARDRRQAQQGGQRGSRRP
jgi:putative ABC transport system substrate-binding protein